MSVHRDDVIRFRVAPDERRAIVDAARRRSMSLSDWCRHQAMSEPITDAEQARLDVEKMRNDQLSRIGNNLNQLVRALNAYGDFDQIALVQIAESIKALKL